MRYFSYGGFCLEFLTGAFLSGGFSPKVQLVRELLARFFRISALLSGFFSYQRAFVRVFFLLGGLFLSRGFCHGCFLISALLSGFSLIKGFF